MHIESFFSKCRYASLNKMHNRLAWGTEGTPAILPRSPKSFARHKSALVALRNKSLWAFSEVMSFRRLMVHLARCRCHRQSLTAAHSQRRTHSGALTAAHSQRCPHSGAPQLAPQATSPQTRCNSLVSEKNTVMHL